MRTHTALHVLCGVIWNEWKVPVTGGNMEPLSARMDFELTRSPGFGPRSRLVNAELRAARPIEVSFSAPTAVEDEDLIRPGQPHPERQRDPGGDIVGLDKQADGGRTWRPRTKWAHCGW
jgi:misacylated tRNA(Ala) deacylase